MGRKSREKRERREAAQKEPFTRLDKASSLDVLAAASLSPTASYRLVSILTAFVALLRRPHDGTVGAAAEHLNELLDGIDDETKSMLPMLEDFVPLDLRDKVDARWRDGLYRLIPGGFEAPVSIIESARFHARVLDPHLTPTLGFGLGDLVELVLRASDAAVEALKPVWPDGELSEDDAVRVSDEECEAVAELPKLMTLADACSDAEAARAALRWATISIESAIDELSKRHHTIGPALAIDTVDGTHPVPPGMLLDVVFEAMPRLRAMALKDPVVAKRWNTAARREALRTLSALGPHVADPEVDGESVDSLVRVEDDLILAVCVVSTPNAGRVQHAKRRLRRVTTGARLELGGGEYIDIDASTEVARLVVLVDGEQMFLGTLADEVHVQTATMQELRWMVSTCQRPSDLPRFLIDRTEDKTRGMSFGTFDQWEVWRTGTPGPFQMGVTPTFVTWASHSERAEWEHHRDTAWVTECLFKVGLGSVAEWTNCTVDDSGPVPVAELIDGARHRAVRIAALDEVVVAVGWDAWDGARLPAVDVARSVVWRLLHARDMVAELADPGDLLRVQVAPGVDGDETSATARRESTGVITLTHSTSGDEEDLAGIEAIIGRSLASLPGVELERAISSWQQAPPGLVLEARSVPFVVPEPSLFTPPHPAIVATERRELARAMHDLGEPVGTYRGTDAVNLEARIDEILRSRLLSLLDGVERESIVLATARSLERLHSRREADEVGASHRQQLRAAAGRSVDLDEVTEASQDLTMWARSLAHVVELALTTQAGDGADREFAGRLQSEVFAVASLVLESGQRRSVIHFELTDVESTISDSYEITQSQSRGRVDVASFTRTRALARLDARDDLEHVSYFGPEDASALNEMLAAHVGFTAVTLRSVLGTVARWPVSQRLLVATTTVAHLVERVLEADELVEHEVRAAIDWLTLRATNLADPLDHWNVDQRDHRLATRPLVDLGADRLLIAPRSADYADSVILGHLTDLRSPWGSAGPAQLRDDLARLRAQRNMRFEREVEAVLNAETSLVTKRNIKKGVALDGWVLEREVDLVVVDRSRRRLWIVDVKDPAVPFAPNQINRSVDRYHGDEGHVAKVLASVERARQHVDGVASELLGEKCSGEWDVLGAIVSRRIEAAAFVDDPRVHFMTPGTAAETLTSDQLPAPAYGAVHATFAE